jgi:hypothetical protein
MGRSRFQLYHARKPLCSVAGRKSYMWNLFHGVLKFALNASIDKLPTFANLKRWGKRASVNCHLCGNTVKHAFLCSCSLLPHNGPGKDDLKA